MEALLTPVLLTIVTAFIAAVILTIAGKVFYVPVDETAVKVRACLPGANCGGCGYAGCDDYANAIAADPENTPCNKCAPGGAATAKAIADILGTNAGDIVPMKAAVACTGTCDATKPEMTYEGIPTCAAAKTVFGGPGSCKYGCIGFGDCAKVCPVGAIEICNGIANIDREKCIGCGACSKACPQSVIAMIPEAKRVYVGCKSQDKGKDVTKNCSAGCIGCKLCEKACKFDAIHVENNLAKVDVDKCKNCGMCAKACPRHIIHVIPRPGQKPVVKVEAPKEVAPAAPKAEENKAEA